MARQELKIPPGSMQITLIGGPFAGTVIGGSKTRYDVLRFYKDPSTGELVRYKYVRNSPGVWKYDGLVYPLIPMPPKPSRKSGLRRVFRRILNIPGQGKLDL